MERNVVALVLVGVGLSMCLWWKAWTGLHEPEWKKKWSGSPWTATDATHLKHWESWKLDSKSLSSHWSCSPSKWQHLAVHKYEKNCRKLMPELHCLGSCTVFLQLEVIGFSYLYKTEATSWRTWLHVGHWSQDSDLSCGSVIMMSNSVIIDLLESWWKYVDCKGN